MLIYLKLSISKESPIFEIKNDNKRAKLEKFQTIFPVKLKRENLFNLFPSVCRCKLVSYKLKNAFYLKILWFGNIEVVPIFLNGVISHVTIGRGRL